jgi:hypothetical protein
MAKGPALPPPSRGILGGKTPAPPPSARSTPFVDYSGHYADTGRGPRPDTGSYRARPTVLNDALEVLGYLCISAVGGFFGLSIWWLIWHWLE